MGPSKPQTQTAKQSTETRETYAETRSAEVARFQKDYIEISHTNQNALSIFIGRGVLEEAKKKNLDKRGRQDLLAQLVVIKIASSLRKNAQTLATELSSYNKIKSAADKKPEMLSRFSTIIGASKEEINKEALCYGLATHYHNCRLPLATFHESVGVTQGIQQLPVEFILHVFLELLAALGFLHEDCKFAHNSLDGASISMDISGKPDDHGFPKLILSDFRMAVCKPVQSSDSFENFQTAKSKDMKDMCTVIRQLADLRISNPGSFKKWTKFCELIREEHDPKSDGSNLLKRLEDSFSKDAQKCKAGRRDETLQRLNDMMWRLAMERHLGVSDSDLVTALNQPRG